jgi:hypothetical protein
MVGILILAFASLLGACCMCQHKKEGAVKHTHTLGIKNFNSLSRTIRASVLRS